MSTFTHVNSINQDQNYHSGLQENESKSQAVQTANYNVEPSLLKVRKEAAQKLQPDDRFGHVSDDAVIDILSNELVFTNAGRNKTRYIASTVPFVFSSFNGVPFEKSQRQTENNYRAVGFAITSRKFGVSDHTSNEKLLVKVGGSGQAINTGPTTIKAGSLVSWSLPPRGTSSGDLIGVRNAGARGKVVAVLQNYEKSDIYELPSMAINLLIDPEDRETIEYRDYEDESILRGYDEVQEMSLLFRRFFTHCTISTILTLSQYGFIVLNTALDIENPELYDMGDGKFFSLDQIGASTVTETLFTPNLGSKQIKIDAKEPAIFRESETRFLFKLLGVEGNNSGNNVTDVLFSRLGFSFLRNNDDRSIFGLDTILPNSGDNSSKLKKELNKLQISAGKDLMEAFFTSFRDAQSRVVCKATTDAHPGQSFKYTI